MIDPETGEIIGLKDNHVNIPFTKPIGKLPFIRTPFNYDMDAASEETGLKCEDPTRAQQQFKEDADINTLVQRFGITGTMPVMNRIPTQGDFTGVTDYHSALNALIAADAEFMKLPAEVRTRFDNDAGKFLDFTSNPENLPELRKMGLAKPEPVKPEPIAVRVIAEPGPAT